LSNKKKTGSTAVHLYPNLEHVEMQAQCEAVHHREAFVVRRIQVRTPGGQTPQAAGQRQEHTRRRPRRLRDGARAGFAPGCSSAAAVVVVVALTRAAVAAAARYRGEALSLKGFVPQGSAQRGGNQAGLVVRGPPAPRRVRGVHAGGSPWCWQ